MRIFSFFSTFFFIIGISAQSQNLIQNSKFDDYTISLDSNKNIVYQPNYWCYNTKRSNHPIYYSSDRFLNKDVLYNFHPDAELVEQGQKLNYISILLLPNTQKAYTILKEPLKKGHKYHLQFDIKAYKQSNCLSDILVGFKDSIDFTNETSNYSIQLTFKDSSSNDYFFDGWYTVSSDFTALGNEKVVLFGAGSEDDYQMIVKSNRKKFYPSYDGGPFMVKYFIDNSYLSEIANDSLIHRIDTLKIGDRIIMQNIYFDFNKYILLKESFPLLDKLVEYLNSKSNIRIQISGHTDNIGIKEYNDKLSMKRAKSVVDYLIIKGIASYRLQPIGFGSEYPIDSNDTEYGRQQNRRIEIKIIAK